MKYLVIILSFLVVSCSTQGGKEKPVEQTQAKPKPEMINKTEHVEDSMLVAIPEFEEQSLFIFSWSDSMSKSYPFEGIKLNAVYDSLISRSEIGPGEYYASSKIDLNEKYSFFILRPDDQYTELHAVLWSKNAGQVLDDLLVASKNEAGHLQCLLMNRPDAMYFNVRKRSTGSDSTFLYQLKAYGFELIQKQLTDPNNQVLTRLDSTYDSYFE